METIRKYLICLVFAAGALQWGVIGERLMAVLWAWYEFSGRYGGGGHITVGRNTQIAFYVLSAILLAIAAWLTPEEPRWRIAGRFSMMLVGAGIAVWTALLFSPLAKFTH